MHILIIEDEAMIARRIHRMTEAYFGNAAKKIHHCAFLVDGQVYLQQNEVDLLLLDLNLNGDDGFEILQNMVAQPFHTIIISAYKEKAITAFEYGVLDFVPKPFNETRLHKALDRVNLQVTPEVQQLKYLAIAKKGRQHLIHLEDVLYIQGARIYTEVFLKNGQKELHNKSLDKLEQLLPESFQRIHKSYLVDMREVTEFLSAAGGKYAVMLSNGEQLPVSRSRFKALKEQWLI
ncbi:DNA-binding response regulator [marine bacterium AO1-C]|nr:DNA-binding response regulator [marine bacterium AO1-C]